MLCAFVFLCALFSLTAVTGCSMSDDDDEETTERVRVGDRIPLFTVSTVNSDGTEGMFTTAQLTGETVIVLFNTSCSDCQRDLPLLNDYYLQHRDDKGFQMVAISREEGAESVAAYWAANGLVMPYSAQPDRRIYSLFASSIIPRIYFCGANGIVTHVFIEKFEAPKP